MTYCVSRKILNLFIRFSSYLHLYNCIYYIRAMSSEYHKFSDYDDPADDDDIYSKIALFTSLPYLLVWYSLIEVQYRVHFIVFGKCLKIFSGHRHFDSNANVAWHWFTSTCATLRYSDNQSNYSIVRPKVDQRAGQLWLPHEGRLTTNVLSYVGQCVIIVLYAPALCIMYIIVGWRRHQAWCFLVNFFSSLCLESVFMCVCVFLCVFNCSVVHSMGLCLAVRLARVCGLSLQPVGCTSALTCDEQRYGSCSCR